MAVGLDHAGLAGCLRQTVPHSGRAVGRWLQRVFVGEGEHHGVCLMGRGEDTTFNRHIGTDEITDFNSVSVIRCDSCTSQFEFYSAIKPGIAGSSSDLGTYGQRNTT